MVEKETYPVRGRDDSEALAKSDEDLAEGKHFISQVVLARFAEPTVLGAGRPQDLLSTVNVLTGHRRKKGRDGCGRYDSLIPFDQDAAERLWKEAEDKLHEAYVALEDGSILGRPDLASTLRDLIALHFARNPHMRERSSAAFDQVAVQQSDELMRYQPAILDRVFFEHYGLYPAGQKGRLIAVDLAQRRLKSFVREGAWYSRQAPYFFASSRRLAAARGLSLIHASEGEFLIGDVPVLLTGKSNTDSPEVAFGAAAEIILPIDPHWMIVLGSSAGAYEMSKYGVDEINAGEVRRARREVYMRPSSGLEALVAEVRPPTQRRPIS